MFNLDSGSVLTKITKYNLMRSGKSLQIDVHELIEGTLAGRYLAVPNLVMIIAKPEYQGIGESEEEALKNCLDKIKNLSVDELFPQQK